MSGIRITIKDMTGFEKLMTDAPKYIKKVGVDILNDMQYVTRGASPFLTGQLEGDISATAKSGRDSFTGEIGISTYNKGFDYGALHHDHPFNLGELSAAKGNVVSPITGNSSEVGYEFASRPLKENESGYMDYIEEELQSLFDKYSS